MGDPVLFKVEGDARDYWIPPENQDRFIERARSQGLRVTKPASYGPLPAQHYGPEDPDLQRREPESVNPADTLYEETGKLPIQKPVPPQPYFPPKGPSVGTEVGLAAPVDAGVPELEAFPDADFDAGTLDTLVSEPQSAGEKALAWARGEVQGGIPDGAQTIGRGVNAKKKPSALESAGYGYIDQAGFGLADEAAGGGAMLAEAISRANDSMRGTLDPDYLPHTARTTRRGADKNAPMGPQHSFGEAVGRAGEEAMTDFAAADKEAYNANPGTYIGSSMMAAVPQSVLMARLMPGALGPAARAEAAAIREAPAMEQWALRTAQGAKDALFNPANVASAAASGAGHVRHDGGDVSDYLSEAGAGAAGEMAFGTMAAPFAQVLLQPFRGIGRNVAAGLSDPLTNPETAHLHQIAKNAGATYETFHKPAERFGGYPRTGARGLSPSEDMQVALRDAKARGVVNPVERARGQVADRVANVLDDEAQSLDLELENARGMEYAKPASTASEQAWDEMLRAAPRDVRADLIAQANQIQEHRAYQGRPDSGQRIDAEMLDQIIDYVDDKAKSHLQLSVHDAARPYDKLSERLREIRRDHFKGPAWAAETHAEKMREHESKKTMFGIPANTKGVKRTGRSEHIQAIDKRLSQGQPDMLLQTIKEMEVTDPETGKLLRQWSGLDAQNRLLTGLKEDLGPVYARTSGHPVGFSGQLLERLRPGMRLAGVENLGPYSGAGVRGGLAAAAPAITDTPTVTPEQVANLAAFLGYTAMPTSEEFERIRQILGLEPEQMEQYRQPP